MKKESSSQCPNCGFNFSKIKPQLDYYTCACKEYCAEITSEGILILSKSRSHACGIYSGFDVLDDYCLKKVLEEKFKNGQSN